MLRQSLKWLVVACTLMSGVVRADGTYRIDVVVFEQPGGADAAVKLAHEFPTLPADAIDLHALAANTDVRFQEQGLLEESLQTAVTRLEQRGYRVLAKRAWLQPGLGTGEAKAVVIDGGDTVLDHPQLQGLMTLTHDEVPLLETTLGLIVSPAPLKTPALQASKPAGNGAEHPATDTPVRIDRVVLQDTRRLKPDTLTYLDHPRIGVLVRCARQGVTPAAR